MSTAEQFLSRFDFRGRYRASDGSIAVAIQHGSGHRFPGTLNFKGGLCVSAEIQGSAPWVFPDGSPLDGLRFPLIFDNGERLAVLIHEGRIQTPAALSADLGLTDAFERADHSGVTVNSNARLALQSLSVREQIAILDAVVELAGSPHGQWPQLGAQRLNSEKLLYLLNATDDMRAFVQAIDDQHQRVELLDIVPEATIRAVRESSRIPVV